MCSGLLIPMAKVFCEIISTSTSQGFQMGLDLHRLLHHRPQIEEELNEANERTGSPHIMKTQCITNSFKSEVFDGASIRPAIRHMWLREDFLFES